MRSNMRHKLLWQGGLLMRI